LRIRKLTPYILGLAIALPVFSLVWGAGPAKLLFPFPAEPAPLPADTPVDLHYPFKDRLTDTYSSILMKNSTKQQSNTGNSVQVKMH
jgi:hypothetical protein